MKTSKSEQGFTHLLVIAVIVLAVAGVGFYVFNKSKSTGSSSPTAVTTTKKASHPGVVRSELFASSLDVSGAPAQPTRTFPDTTPKIYAALRLNGAKTTQKLEYTRYLNGKYVDHGSIPITKDNAKYASIVFNLKPGKTHVKGRYLVKTYTNGVFERSAGYTIQ